MGERNGGMRVKKRGEAESRGFSVMPVSLFFSLSPTLLLSFPLLLPQPTLFLSLLYFCPHFPWHWEFFRELAEAQRGGSQSPAFASRSPTHRHYSNNHRSSSLFRFDYFYYFYTSLYSTSTNPYTYSLRGRYTLFSSFSFSKRYDDDDNLSILVPIIFKSQKHFSHCRKKRKIGRFSEC